MYEVTHIIIEQDHKSAPLADILRFHDVQFYLYADDDLELTSSIVKIENCLSDLDKWMALNKLKLNKDKRDKLSIKPGSKPGSEPGSELGSEPGSEPGL